MRWMTKRDVEKVRGRDEGSRVELGPGRKAGSGQTTMAFLGVGLIDHARRGLSKYDLLPNVVACPTTVTNTILQSTRHIARYYAVGDYRGL